MLTEGMFVGDRYEIIGKIGAGGMSDVYKAMDHTLSRNVAIKVLKAEFSEDVNFVTKFRTEAQSAAGLEHPNIVNIYDVGSENEFHYIVMEYVEGITLKTYVEKKGQLTYKEAVSIAIQVGRGIEAAHNKNIIHRDIKPQNIIISKEGKVKVTDFGIARAATTNTINSDVMGSVHYASPEQARNGFVDGKSDIYSLGIVMYEMVTGRVPFDGDTTVAVAIQHLQEEMVSPSAYAPNLPISLEKIILKCTQKNADRRYENIAALLSDLRKSLISPNEDFVVMVPVSQEKTRIIGEDDVNQIKQKTGNIGVSEDEFVKSALKKEMFDEDDEEEDDELDDEDEINPKMDKAITIMGIAAGVVIIALIIFILVSFFGDFKFGGGSKDTEIQTETQTETETTADTEGTIEVPDLTGYTFDEAKEVLNGLNLGIKEIGTISSEEYEEGLIVEQKPGKDEKVAAHTTIEVTISSGEGEIEIPNVVGMDGETAYNTLLQAGFDPDDEPEYSDTVPEGQVISQSPAAKNSAKKGDRVVYKVSMGAQTIVVSVPSVLNYTQEIAVQTLSQNGLAVGTITTKYSNDVTVGCVISQGVSAGTQVTEGTKVDLVVSLGKELVTVPDVVKTEGTKAVSNLQNLGFTVSKSEAYSSDVPEGYVISQSVSAGLQVEAGASITVTISKGAEPAPQPSETPKPSESPQPSETPQPSESTQPSESQAAASN